MENTRIGVVGVGRMGTYHLGALSELPEIDLTGIVDIDLIRLTLS